MTPVPDASVIVRARDEARNLERLLPLLAEQGGDLTVELVLVDGGSRDGTAALARAHGARVLHLPAAEFTFGGALNLGAANAGAAVLVALSAHAFPVQPEWLARLVEQFDDARVACACGDSYGPDGEPLASAIEQDIALARRRPEWGYSNAAGAFRAELWRRRPFRTDLPGCEDKEWAWHWLARGYVCVVAPGLAVDHDHTHDSLRSIYGRARREAIGYAAFAGPAPTGPRALAREWWSDLRWYHSPLQARLSHRRAARLLGAYAGRREASMSNAALRDDVRDRPQDDLDVGPQ
jgi:rhamnosyltransferase